MHNHPSNSAPSPSDIYHAMRSLDQMVYNDNISQNQFVNYIDKKHKIGEPNNVEIIKRDGKKKVKKVKPGC